MLKRIFAIVNLILILAALAVGNHYIEHGTVRLKVMAGIGFVTVGVVNLVYSFIRKKKICMFSIFMVMGLVFSVMGDAAIDSDFVRGALLFGMGHLSYLCAYCVHQKPQKTDMIPIAVIALATVIFLSSAPVLVVNDKLKMVCIIYGIVISGMAGKAISNLFRKPNAANVILVMGSCLFYFSDLMLAIGRFTFISHVSGLLCLMTYYPAQCMLAFSIYLDASDR